MKAQQGTSPMHQEQRSPSLLIEECIAALLFLLGMYVAPLLVFSLERAS